MTAALGDILGGIRQAGLWSRIGWTEIRRRYKRTVLGPLWATLSMAIFIGALGFLWATLWQVPVREYLPFLTAGFLVWVLITSIVQESCLAYVSAEPIIKQVRLPYTLHLMCVVWRNLIVFGHHLVVYAVVVALYPQTFGVSTILVVPGLLLVLVNCLWVGLILSVVCTRYRDIPTLVASILQIALFVTPIMWPPQTLTGRKALIVDANPAYHLIELVRAPMLGGAAAPTSWWVCGGMAVAGWICAVLMFRRYRAWIPYWL